MLNKLHGQRTADYPCHPILRRENNGGVNNGGVNAAMSLPESAMIFLTEVLTLL